MNCVLSLWTGTDKFALRRNASIITTLGVCLAAKHYPVVEFVTDDAGLAVGELLGWRFTKYFNVMDELKDRGLNHVWALGKLVTALHQRQPFIQIDHDVLLLKPLPAHLRHARLFAQSIDHPHYYRSANMQRALEIAGLEKGHVAYNCGIIGGCDLHLLHSYAREALALAERFKDNPLNGTTSSMMVEQYFLGAFAHRHGVRVETLISIRPSVDELRATGYLHLTGATKHDPIYAAKAEARMEKEFPEAYDRFVRGWERAKKDSIVGKFIQTDEAQTTSHPYA